MALHILDRKESFNRWTSFKYRDVLLLRSLAKTFKKRILPISNSQASSTFAEITDPGHWTVLEEGSPMSNRKSRLTPHKAKMRTPRVVTPKSEPIIYSLLSSSSEESDESSQSESEAEDAAAKAKTPDGM